MPRPTATQPPAQPPAQPAADRASHTRAATHRASDSAQLCAQIQTCADPQSLRTLLFDNLDHFEPAVAEAVKNRAIAMRLTNTQHALGMADALAKAAHAVQSQIGRGYGLWAEAIIRSLELAEYEAALARYDEAIAIFAATGDTLSPATMQISRIWSLANLNRHTEAFAEGERAAQVLQAHGKWLQLATLQMNLGGIHSRLGEDTRALEMFQAARRAYSELGGAENDEIASLWAAAVNNCSISRCYLGDFSGSLEDSHTALAVQERLHNHVEAARVRQHVAVTCFLLGRYNEALKLLQEARAVFYQNELHRHAARVDLYACDCLLRLRRFAEVLPKSQHARSLFQAQKTLHEEALALLYTAMAHAGLGEDEAALAALAEAAAIFDREGSAVWRAYADLERAILLLRARRDAEALQLAQSCAARFRRENLPVKEAEAHLQSGHAIAALHQPEQAESHFDRALAVARAHQVADLAFRAHHALGNLARAHADLAQAETHYAAAIHALESLRGRLMIEYRVNFQEDKQIIYEDMVDLCLSVDAPARALAYAERAKSRALIDLLEYRVDLRVRARAAQDQPLVDQLLHLRAERDRLYRRWENNEELRERGGLLAADTADLDAVRRLEQQIAELWHTLLVRNADYAEDAALWQVSPHAHITAADPDLGAQLPADTVLVEYFSVHDRLIVFLVDAQNIRAYRLEVSLGELKGWIERLARQMRAVPRFPAAGLPGLTRQTQVILRKLHELLIAPILPHLAHAPNLIIVPHDVLHYLPFHALYDGTRYLLEQFTISYLPSAGLLRQGQLHQRQAVPPTQEPTAADLTASHATDRGDLLAVGFSANGALPNVQHEIAAIGRHFAAHTVLEQDATLDRLRELGPKHRILHLATHAEVHDQQPLFSGLLLEDGWLTTLDIFNLHLDADLVTLSACQTGRSAIGGGDELLGLMRALLYAGASALVMSMWAVEDRSTAQLMAHFYAELARGVPKHTALRNAQLRFIRPQNDAPSHAPRADQPTYAHPYFWAPFFLVGDAGPLPQSTIGQTV